MNGTPFSDLPTDERAYVDAWRAGRAAWPMVVLDKATFTAHARALGVTVDDLQRHGADFFLAVGCARGDAGALAEFERTLLVPVPRHTARFSLSPDEVAEVRQELRIRLLMGAPPRIATYAGRAPLDAWVRVAAVRVTIDSLRAADRHKRQRDDDMLCSVLEGLEICPVDRLDSQAVGPQFQRALERGLLHLPEREKAVLRMYFIDQLNIDAIGAVFRVHRATVARWLAVTRRQLLEGIQAEVNVRLRATTSEFQSLARVVGPAMTLSLDRLLPMQPPALT